MKEKNSEGPQRWETQLCSAVKARHGLEAGRPPPCELQEDKEGLCVFAADGNVFGQVTAAGYVRCAMTGFQGRLF